MRTRFVAALAAVALAGGCGTALDRPEAVARPAAALPSTGTPSGAAFDREAFSERVKKVLMAPGALVGVGVAAKPQDEFDADYTTSDYCNLSVVGEGPYSHVAHLRAWRSQSITIYNAAHGYDTITAKEAVDSTRRHAENCASYVARYSTGTVKYELLDVVDLGSAAGVDDRYGRCEKRTFDNDPPLIACVAYLGRGKLLSQVTVYHGGTAASATAKLLQIVPIAAAALAAA
jgi:hypothetical protein